MAQRPTRESKDDKRHDDLQEILKRHYTARRRVRREHEPPKGPDREDFRGNRVQD